MRELEKGEGVKRKRKGYLSVLSVLPELKVGRKMKKDESSKKG